MTHTGETCEYFSFLKVDLKRVSYALKKWIISKF